MDRNLPIGIFDSGVGGLTVYRALHERLPSERYVYLGDTARVPYGTKSLSTVERYAIENARFLESRGMKLLVVACNTASALALPAIRRSVSVPVVGMIEPGAAAAVREAAGGRVGVIATESTVKSGAYSRAVAALAPELKVTERACPLFVSLAEEGWAESEVARAVAEEYLKELREKGVSAVVLGCTHYPILRRVIQETLGEPVKLIDSGEAAAEAVESLIEKEDLRRTATQELRDLREAGAHARFLCDDLDHFYVTDAAERFAHVAERFLGAAPRRLEAVEVWGHDELQTR
ncbi:MAG TPA: glutamate racemase [Pyrinomonadaceae bacterium]|nr:glutamate racemase [Pyrinomonadaceae bacterium]